MANSGREMERVSGEMNAGESESDGGFKKELTLIVELVGSESVTRARRWCCWRERGTPEPPAEERGSRPPSAAVRLACRVRRVV